MLSYLHGIHNSAYRTVRAHTILARSYVGTQTNVVDQQLRTNAINEINATQSAAVIYFDRFAILQVMSCVVIIIVSCFSFAVRR